MYSANAATRKATARRFVENIAKEHGYLGDEDYAKMDVELRRKVEYAMLKSHLMIGTSIITLAKNLYSKDARFIFELLQNADDNHFSRATRLNRVPYVSFHVYKWDRIIIECNEDGFSEANLSAICNIGKSSKTGAQGYIGEKGIGFKSVFKVAWRVHIQSGDYSFTLTHRKKDSGMGMVSPEWLEPTEELAAPLTRMTLFLHNDGSSSELDIQRQSILDQLCELQPTMLLFLKNLKRIEVHIYDEDGNESLSSVLSANRPNEPNRPVLEQSHNKNGNTTHKKQKYHVVESTARNLPRNENREYSAGEEALKAYSNAPVVLAFALSDDDVPVIEPQEVFAFLPVRQVGFNFLIHSDFVTQANREDIVATSPRNIHLLDALADAFLVAMRELCQHPTLKYQWMRYLPKLSDYPWYPFWQRLVEKIKTRICDEKILILGNSTNLITTKQARRLSTMQIDQYGNPLFDDLRGNAARYLTSAYRPSDLDLLKDYGLRYLLQDEFLERVRKDLSCITSRMKSVETDNNWHGRAARCMNLSFEKGWTERIIETRTLRLVPLDIKLWVPSSIPHKLYFAVTSDGLEIPTDLGLLLVDCSATRPRDRKELLVNLGVKYASVDDVRAKILQRYKSAKSNMIGYKTSMSHLSFLYWAHDDKYSIDAYTEIGLCDAGGQLHSLLGHEFYLNDTNPHGLWELAKKADKFPSWSNVHFMDDRYFEDPPDDQDRWEDWLMLLGVRNAPRLISRDASTLSEECQFVAEHVPSGLLGFLRYGWDSEKPRITPQRMDDLKALKVICRGGQAVNLASTYLPLPALLEKREEFMRHGEFFPFLDLGESQLMQWEFLNSLGVKTNPDLDFYLDILNNIRLKGPNPTEPSRILRLYLRIYAEYANSTDRDVRRDKIRGFFDEHTSIFIPSLEGKSSYWSIRTLCLLDAPIEMQTASPMLSLYRAAFSTSGLDFSDIEKFLRDVLGIQRCSWEHIVKELKNCQGDDHGVSLRVKVLYKSLNNMSKSAATAKDLRNAFELHRLIFADAGSQRWHSPSQCIWSSTPAPILRKVNLSDVYSGDMEKFFVERLGVPHLDANLIYKELLELNPDEVTVEHVKELLWSLNSKLEVESLDASPEALLECQVLPIRHVGGQVRLHSSDTEFAIVDRKNFGEFFQERVKVLDFSHNDICRLRPLLKWARLEDRYLSQLVKETSVLDSGIRQRISDPNQDIRRKAYGLFRIATHFKSPRIEGNGQGFYDLLRTSRTWETQGISKTLVVSIDGETVTEEVDQGDLHIDDATGLEIYVPQEEEIRDQSYLSALPKHFARWMMADPTAPVHKDIDHSVEALVQGIFRAKVSQVDYLLVEEGVIEVAIPEQSEQEEDVSTNTPPASILASTPTAVGPSTPERVASPVSEPVTPVFDDENRYWRQETPATNFTSYTIPSPSLAGGVHVTRERLSPDPFTTRVNERQRTAAQEYCALLSQIVLAARKSRALASSLDLSDLFTALVGDRTPESSIFNEYDLFGGGMASMERDRRVGAAGELFVFELLRSMNPVLRGFTRDNWTSTIRRYATDHPDFADMASWTGIETSDIEYKDTDGALTEALVHKGYLERSWQTRRPQYYIEVKSTPGSFDTPFFMSNAQYHKMRRLSTEDSVYIIFRVFNLYTGQIGVNLYVDPARMGQLVFTADKWTVKPVFQSR
ncbi:hypothetical protein F4677DRAFT_456697 [Hypoxylon crocopeplum]|nr:hypothetical protein F4677DRAFT_456697 [Hypoxylon crocopeplum]